MTKAGIGTALKGDEVAAGWTFAKNKSGETHQAFRRFENYCIFENYLTTMSFSVFTTSPAAIRTK